MTSSSNKFADNINGIRVTIGASFEDTTSTFSANQIDVCLDGGELTGADVAWKLNKEFSACLNGDVNIKSGGKLTIKAGTVVKPSQYRYLGVDGGGTLVLAGTAAEPVYFTDWRDDTVGGDANHDGGKTAPAPDWWNSIYLRDGAAATMDYATIRYGGYWDNSGVYKTGAGVLAMSNCSVTNTDGHGVFFNDSAAANTIKRRIRHRPRCQRLHRLFGQHFRRQHRRLRRRLRWLHD